MTKENELYIENVNLIKPLKDPPDKCYHCDNPAEKQFRGKLTIQTETYSQMFCVECYGRILEFASDVRRAKMEL